MGILGIFVFYSRRGEVNAYVRYLLKEIKKEITALIIVCNGTVTEEGRAYLTENCEIFWDRPNKGFDAGAYQDVILNFVGFNKIKEYDALLLFNNSFYGPIYPFGEMFSKMQIRNLDFWGITAGGNNDGKNTPYHIQSYFLMISNRILQSKYFEEYWKTQAECLTFLDAVVNFELRFTNYFMAKGFTCATYIERGSIEKCYDISCNILSRLGFELISEYKLPVLKKKCIMLDVKEVVYQNNEDILNYIDLHTNYNVDFIWEDIIKEYTPYELNTRRFLRYIVSPCVYQKSRKDTFVVVIYSAYYAEYINFLNLSSRSAKIIVLIDSNMNHEKVKGHECRAVKNENDFWNVFRNILSDYKWCEKICVLSDSIWSQSIIDRNRTVVDICNKLLYSDEYIEEVQKLFEKHHRLGILLPETECSFEFWEHIGKKNRLTERHLEILTALQCESESVKGEKILENCGCFWFRPYIFNFLLQYGKNIPFTWAEVMEILPYLAKKEGYFTAIVNNAGTMNKEYSLKCQIIDSVFERLNFYTMYFDLDHGLSNIAKENVVDFARRHEGVYIYGAGVYGQKCFGLLRRYKVNIIGFVVTDTGMRQTENSNVWCIDEIELKRNEAIIVALSKKNQQEVLDKLERYSKDQVYYV